MPNSLRGQACRQSRPSNPKIKPPPEESKKWIPGDKWELRKGRLKYRTNTVFQLWLFSPSSLDVCRKNTQPRKASGWRECHILQNCPKNKDFFTSHFRRFVNVSFFLRGGSPCLNFVCRRFGILVHATYEDGTECSETSVHKIKAPRYRPTERLRQTQRWRGNILWQQVAASEGSDSF
jgi:hypothetical protein